MLLKIIKWILGIIISLILMLALTLFVINKFYFVEIIGLLVAKVSNDSEITLSIGKSTGSFFSGEIVLENVKIVHDNVPVNEFGVHIGVVSVKFDPSKMLFETKKQVELIIKDVQVVKNKISMHNMDVHFEGITVSLDISKLLFGTKTINKISLANVKGSLELLQIDKVVEPIVVGSSKGAKWSIEQLELKGANFKIIEKFSAKNIVKKEFVVAINQLFIVSINSEKLLQDVLFNSNISGLVNDSPFSVENTAHKISVKIKTLPLNIIGHYVGGALSWMVDGTINLVIDGIKVGDILNMHFNIDIHELSTLGMSNSTVNTLQVLLTGVYLNFPDNIISSFELMTNKNEFINLETLRRSVFLEELAANLEKSVKEA